MAVIVWMAERSLSRQPFQRNVNLIIISDLWPQLFK